MDNKILNQVTLANHAFLIKFIECEDLEGDRNWYANFADIEKLCSRSGWKEYHSDRLILGGDRYTTTRELIKILIIESCQAKTPAVIALVMTLAGESGIDNLLRLAIEEPQELHYFYETYELYLDWILTT